MYYKYYYSLQIYFRLLRILKFRAFGYASRKKLWRSVILEFCGKIEQKIESGLQVPTFLELSANFKFRRTIKAQTQVKQKRSLGFLKTIKWHCHNDITFADD